MDKKQLQRIHRVRTLQLGLAQANEAKAAEGLASETALAGRIADLARAVSPTPSATPGVSLAAAAHYRERLHQSAHAAEARVVTATRQAEAATAARQEAHRDQSAVEKLLARADHAELLKAMRALEDAPVFRKVRHDPC
jgi:flagellar FliJ protein